MNDFVIVAAVSSVIGLFSFSSGVGLYETTSKILATPPDVSMSLKDLRFEGGKFHQEFYVTGVDVIDANWSAEINRGVEQLCYASGRAPYQNEKPKAFPPDGWAGQFAGDCGDLQAGDIGIAVWSYETEAGVRVRISGEIVIQ